MTYFIDSWIPCENCNAPLNVNNKFYKSYYTQEDIICHQCNRKIDISKQLLKAINLNFMNTGLFQLLQLPTLSFTVTLQKEKVERVPFEQYGISRNAKIVFINYTTQKGNGYAIQVHGNNPYTDLPQDEVSLYPLFFEGTESNEIDVSVTIMWSEHEDREIKYLLDGFYQYNKNNFEDMVIPLNIAMESYFTDLIYKHFESIWNKDTAERLVKELDYSSILNKLLIDMAKANNWYLLPKEDRKNLTTLLELRNQVAHSGKFKKDLTEKEANSIIKSIVLAYHFCRITLEDI